MAQSEVKNAFQDEDIYMEGHVAMKNGTVEQVKETLHKDDAQIVTSSIMQNMLVVNI